MADITIREDNPDIILKVPNIGGGLQTRTYQLLALMIKDEDDTTLITLPRDAATMQRLAVRVNIPFREFAALLKSGAPEIDLRAHCKPPTFDSLHAAFAVVSEGLHAPSAAELALLQSAGSARRPAKTNPEIEALQAALAAKRAEREKLEASYTTGLNKFVASFLGPKINEAGLAVFTKANGGKQDFAKAFTDKMDDSKKAEAELAALVSRHGTVEAAARKARENSRELERLQRELDETEKAFYRYDDALAPIDKFNDEAKGKGEGETGRQKDAIRILSDTVDLFRKAGRRDPQYLRDGRALIEAYEKQHGNIVDALDKRTALGKKMGDLRADLIYAGPANQGSSEAIEAMRAVAKRIVVDETEARGKVKDEIVGLFADRAFFDAVAEEMNKFPPLLKQRREKIDKLKIAEDALKLQIDARGGDALQEIITEAQALLATTDRRGMTALEYAEAQGSPEVRAALAGRGSLSLTFQEAVRKDYDLKLEKKMAELETALNRLKRIKIDIGTLKVSRMARKIKRPALAKLEFEKKELEIKIKGVDGNGGLVAEYQILLGNPPQLQENSPREIAVQGGSVQIDANGDVTVRGNVEVELRELKQSPTGRVDMIEKGGRVTVFTEGGIKWMPKEEMDRHPRAVAQQQSSPARKYPEFYI